MGGDEAKLREELAAMTKKATDLEVVMMIMMLGMVMVMMILGMVVMVMVAVVVVVMMVILVVIIIILITFIIITIDITTMNNILRYEYEGWREWVRKPAIGIKPLNGREGRLSGIIINLISSLLITSSSSSSSSSASTSSSWLS